jgi:UDP-N-acetylglucosamine 1-carboxyvinyltransferase
MESFVIDGGYALNGVVTPSGNKNAALPMLAACLLTDEPVILHNVPNIRDVGTMMALLEAIGVDVRDEGNGTHALRAYDAEPGQFDPDLFRHIRGSILLAGPMLARFGHVNLPRPGERKIKWGRHPIGSGKCDGHRKRHNGGGVSQRHDGYPQCRL